MKKVMSMLLCVILGVTTLVGCSGGQSSSAPASDGAKETVSESAASTEAAAEAAESESSGDVVNLTFYFPTQTSGPLAVTMEEIVKAYNDQNPNVNVEAVFTGGYPETIEKTLTSIAGSNAPNVILCDTSYLALLEVDAVVDVQPLIDAEDEGFIDDYVENFWSYFRDGDHTWGVPFQHSAPIMYYNKDIFSAAGLDPEAAPATWSELRAAAEAIAAYDSSLVPFEFQGDPWLTQAMACSDGGDVWIDKNKMTFNSEAVVESLEYWKGLLDDEIAMDNTNYGGVTENFLAGSTAIMFNSTGSLGNVAATSEFNWGIAPIPANDGKKPGAPLGGGGLIMISGHPDEETAAAWDFVKYMTSPEVTAKWSITSGYFAVRYSAYDLPEMQEHFSTYPQYNQTIEIRDTLVAPYMTKKQSEVADIFKNAIAEVLVNDADAQTTMDQAQADADAVMSS